MFESIWNLAPTWMCTIYRGYEFIEERRQIVLKVVVEEVQKAFYFGIIIDGTPNASHTETDLYHTICTLQRGKCLGMQGTLSQV